LWRRPRPGYASGIATGVLKEEKVPRKTPAPERQLLFYSVNNLGDMLCTTPVVRALRRRHPDAFTAYIVPNSGYCRILDGNPDLDLVLYREDLLVCGEGIVNETWWQRLPLPQCRARQVHRFEVVSLLRSEVPAPDDHISSAFARAHGVEIESVRPIVSLSPEERASAARLVSRPYIVFGMHATTAVRAADGHPIAKDWVFDRWLRLARAIHAWGTFDIIAVGAASEPQVHSRYFRNLYGLPIKTAAALLERAACVVTIEGGLSHVCHAVDASTVLLFSKHVPYAWASPREATSCRVIYDDPRLISCEEVLVEIEAVIASRWGGGAAPRP
jgi:ADP-heptose:LPS heptosyltransferase